MKKPEKKVNQSSKTIPLQFHNVAYKDILSEIINLLETARRTASRSVNSIMTATYWEIGRRIVAYEQHGEKRARYGKKVLKNLALELTSRFGRGFSERNLEQMRLFYLTQSISQTLSSKSQINHEMHPVSEKSQTLSSELSRTGSMKSFPLPWSHYVRLLSIKNPEARQFYESEAIRGGWTVRQLDRQIQTQFYE